MKLDCDAAILFGLSIIVRLFIIKVEQALGLTKHAWIISTFGTVIVPVALLGLVWLVRSQILN